MSFKNAFALLKNFLSHMMEADHKGVQLTLHWAEQKDNAQCVLYAHYLKGWLQCSEQ